MKKRGKWIIVLGIFIVILLYITYTYRSRDVKIGMEYTRGKTPGSFLVTFRDNYLIYKDWVYFVDKKNNLKKIKLDGSDEVCIIEGDNKTISDILVIEDTMYFIRSNEFENVELINRQSGNIKIFSFK